MRDKSHKIYKLVVYWTNDRKIYKSRHTEINTFEYAITVIKLDHSGACAPFSVTNYVGTRNRRSGTLESRIFKAIHDAKRLFGGRFGAKFIPACYLNNVMTRLRENEGYSGRIRPGRNDFIVDFESRDLKENMTGWSMGKA